MYGVRTYDNISSGVSVSVSVSVSASASQVQKGKTAIDGLPDLVIRRRRRMDGQGVFPSSLFTSHVPSALSRRKGKKDVEK
jgi:hypothetical protein